MTVLWRPSSRAIQNPCWHCGPGVTTPLLRTHSARRSGWEAVRDAGMRAASQVADGEAFSVEGISSFATAELAYEVEIHRFRARLGGAGESAPLSTRVTTIYRLEENGWRVAHRHADAITGESSD